jgi:hypothetical protein
MTRRSELRDRKFWVHSNPEPAPPDQPAQPCVLGCVLRGEHKPGCICTLECKEHPGHCSGCAPRPAHARSQLCGRCFYRRLRSPLRQLPDIHDWLGARMGGMRTNWSEPGVTGSRETPLPINADMHDLRGLNARLLAGWAHRAAAEHVPPIRGPAHWDVRTTAGWLDRHATWCAQQAWVPALIGHLGELTGRARGLVPWEQYRTRLPLPCPKCEQMTLTLFGGEDWVTCIQDGCDEVIGWFRYQRLIRAIVKLHEQIEKAS